MPSSDAHISRYMETEQRTCIALQLTGGDLLYVPAALVKRQKHHFTNLTTMGKPSYLWPIPHAEPNQHPESSAGCLLLASLLAEDRWPCRSDNDSGLQWHGVARAHA